ncbi:MAG: metallophosphoesterase family protein [Candidatus Gastranaerophilales bacterium]|nr:metallophosphoesterase family protein [Candidatus Gastranaerophilales bacterium]
MKIAVISDIHANKDALDKVLEDINQFNPDKIFCLGDLILAGYNPNYVCEKMLELKEKFGENFKIIQGNTDKMVSNCTEEMLENTKKAFPCMGYSLEQDVKITDKKYLDFVRELPEKKEVILNGLKIELVHGSSRNQSENIYPNLAEAEVEEMVKDSPADVILCGHTHIPCGYSLNSGKTIINVGSVGRSMTQDKNAVYLQMTIDDKGQFFVEHRIINYDNEKVSKHILSRNFKHCEDLAKMYIKEN